MTERYEFADSVLRVQNWLNENTDIASFVEHSFPYTWKVKLPYSFFGFTSFDLKIPLHYPYEPLCAIFDKRLFLKFPHIESNGKLCLNYNSVENRISNPTGDLALLLESVSNYVLRNRAKINVANDFNEEVNSYWGNFCDSYGLKKKSSNAVIRFFLSLDHTMTHRHYDVLVHRKQKECLGFMISFDYNYAASVIRDRVELSGGTIIKGRALYLTTKFDDKWDIENWPKSSDALSSWVDYLSDGTYNLSDELTKCDREKITLYFVTINHRGVIYPFQILCGIDTNLSINPIRVVRLDAAWGLARNNDLNRFNSRINKKIAVLGCGSLGSIVSELLARAGLRALSVIDKEVFEPENCSRHILGMSSVCLNKAEELAKRINIQVPNANVVPYVSDAVAWVRDNDLRGYDFIIDCTAEPDVRVYLDYVVHEKKLNCTSCYAWVEPFCAATHLVLISNGDRWSTSDSIEKINYVYWPDSIRINSCGVGFHPYGVADIWASAGFITERILGAIDETIAHSCIHSHVRSWDFIEASAKDARKKPWFPDFPKSVKALTVERDFRGTLYGNASQVFP